MFNSEPKTAHARVISGSVVLLTGSGLVTGINFAYNVAVAQFLGPEGFGHATAVYTILILLSAVTLSFQIVSAKLVAQQESAEAKSAAYRSLHRPAWVCGIALALLLLLFRNVISQYLNLPSPILVSLLAAGVAFYVPLGTRRGYIQGACSFRGLAVNLILEGFVRLIGSLILIFLGLGVPGVIAANAAAIMVAYVFAIHKLPVGLSSDLHVAFAFREGLQAIVFFVGQVAINNCDIIVVKHFFSPAYAGLYAAIALVGRVVYAFSWAVISTMFPISAGNRSTERRSHGILATSAILVFVIGSLLTLSLRLAPPNLWTLIFGSRFVEAHGHSIASLLVLYAATTTVYSLSVVIIAYQMSYKIANTGWVQLAFSVALVAGMYRFHQSLEQVIQVQLVMMIVLLAVVAAPFLVDRVRPKTARGRSKMSVSGELRRIRPVAESEVIAEFLKNDFQNPEFEHYQDNLGEIVETPNFDDESANALRKALLFIRHGALWRELPAPTAWYEVQVTQADLGRIRVFPRAQWRKLARGDYALPKITERLATADYRDIAEDAFLSKIQNLRSQVQQGAAGGAVLLIGLSEKGPFTVLDGNHRLVAATLVSPEALGQFRFFCGVSARMDNCCWYETNTATLMRYGFNLLRNLIRDPEAELERLLQSS